MRFRPRILRQPQPARDFLDDLAAMIAADVVREARDAKRQRPQVRREHPVIVNLDHLDPDDEPGAPEIMAKDEAREKARRRYWGLTLENVVETLKEVHEGK